MKYLIWKDCRNYEDDAESYSDENRHCDCTCCGICSKYYKNEELNVLCTGRSYAELFGGNVPKDPTHKVINIDHTKYMITQVSCIENDMIEITAKKVDWRKVKDFEV